MDLAPLSGPHLPAIFAAILAEQLLGVLWYHPRTFSPAWLKAWKLDVRKIDKRDPVPFAVSVVKSAFAVMTLDYLMRHLGWTGALGGLRAALYVFTGFTALNLATHYRFAQVSFKALALDLGYDLAALSASGLILGAWR